MGQKVETLTYKLESFNPLKKQQLEPEMQADAEGYETTSRAEQMLQTEIVRLHRQAESNKHLIILLTLFPTQPKLQTQKKLIWTLGSLRNI